MKNLVALLKMKAQKQNFVIQTDQGLVPMTNNAKGVIKNVDESIAFELFGESPLSEENQKLFAQLKRVKMEAPKAKKEKDKKV
jgi:hypothetical protein